MKHQAGTTQFEELRSIDLQRCDSVGDIVNAMRYCAFGARMLGEVAKTICEMASVPDKPLLIYDGLENTPLGRLLKKFVKNRWCRRMVTPAAYAKQKTRGGNVIVVGAFSERDAEAIYKKPKRAIFINPFDMARPGQVRDGFFPDAVFADPRFIMPVIYAALDEWLNGRRSSITSFISGLRRQRRLGSAGGARRKGS